MKWIVREEIVRSVLVEANTEDEALEKAAEKFPQDWDQSTKASDVEPA